MDFAAIYHFLFETYEGIGCLVGGALVLSFLFALVAERRTRKMFRDRGNTTDEPEDNQEE